MDDWRIAAELAARFGADFGLETVEDVQDEIARVAPALRRRRRRPRSAAPATARCSRSPTTPTRSCSTHVLGVTTGRVVGADPAAAPTSAVATADARPTDGADRRRRREADARRADAADGRGRGAAAAARAARAGTGTAEAAGAVPPDAYSLRLVAARTLYDAGRIVSSSPSLAALAPGAALVVHPSDLEPHRRQRRGRRRARHQRRAAPVTLPVLADAATAPGTAFLAFAQRGDVGAQRPRRRRRAGHRAPRGDAAVTRLARASPTRCSPTASTLTVVLIVIGKTIAVFVLLLLLGAHLHLVPAQGHRRHAEPDRARPRRARSGCSRRSPTASSCSSRSSRCPTPPTGASSCSRRTSRSCPRSSRSRSCPSAASSPSPGTRRSCSSPTSRSAILWLLAMSGLGLYGVMLAGWSSGSKYPLLGSVRASAQLLSYEAAFGLAIVGVLVQSNTLSTRGIVDPAGLGRLPVDLQRRLVLAARDRRVRDLRDRGGRRDEPPAVRPRRGGAGAHRRVLHRVHRHPVRDLLPRRVHEPDHDVARSR